MNQAQTPNQFKKILDRTWSMLKAFGKKASPSFIAIGIGIVIGLIIMVAFNPAGAFQAMGRLLFSGLTSSRNMGQILYFSAPIILTGLAVAFAFKSGLFNIGASGQLMMGVLAAITVGIKLSLPAPFGWIVAMLAAALAGFIWGVIPGLMKAHANVNEVVTSIMMNYIGAYLFAIMIDLFLEQGNTKQSFPISSGSQIPSLSSIFPGSNANIGILFAILIAIGFHILIHKTTLGYQLKASGLSMPASKYAGMNTKKNIVLAMALSGMLAGIGGAVLALVANKTQPVLFGIFTEGFDGISVSLIGLGEPIGVIFSGLLLGMLRVGAFNVQLNDFDENIIKVIQGIMIYTIAVSVAIQIGLRKLIAHMKSKKQIEEAGEQA